MKLFGPDELQTIDAEIGFWMTNAVHPATTLEHAGGFYEEVQRHRRAAGIMRLLLHADVDGFHHELVAGAQAWRHWLWRAQAFRWADYTIASSHFDGFFDALAAGAFALATQIAELSPPAWRQGEEYEEDFCYARALHSLLREGDKGYADRVELLDRGERALPGGAYARIALVRALDAKSQRAFDDAFEALLLERDADVARLRNGLAAEDALAAAETYVFVEGLALLRLAERAGLTTAADYRHCPPLARLAMSTAPPPDLFELD